jgi:RNA polymerase sigma-70 factor (ECF subfamily)
MSMTDRKTGRRLPKKEFANPFKGREDIELMLRVKRGDVEAFEKLYEQYKGPIGGFFYHLVWDQSLAEDFLQEVFLRLWKSAADYVPSGKFSTFLFQIAKNFWLNERMKRLREPRVSLDAPLEGKDEDYRLEVAGNIATPSTIMANAEMKANVQEAIEYMPEKQRITFVLSEFQGLKYEEISDILEVPLGTVKSRMAGAEKFLREKLKKFYSEYR